MYHVGVSNIFELLDDENDEGGKREVPRVAVQETAPTKGTKPAPVNQKKTDAPAQRQSGRNDRSDNKFERKPRPEGERGPRTDRPRRDGERPRRDGDRPPRTDRPPREPREPREPRAPREPRDDAPFDRTEQRRDRKEREHGQFARSQAGADGAPRKRVYDRKSGTGRGKEVKRGGGGAGNWGTENGDGKWDEKPVAEDIAKIEGQPEGEQQAPAAPQETEEQKKAREEEEKRIKEEEEKEAKLMGLADYKKKQAEERAKLPELGAVRQAGEGVDKKEAAKWATYTISKKDDEDEKQFDGKKKEKKDPKKQSVSADLLNFQAKKPERREREGRDRDNKNSPKFNKGGDASKKKRSGPAAPDVKDNSNFPALSTKA